MCYTIKKIIKFFLLPFLLIFTFLSCDQKYLIVKTGDEKLKYKNSTVTYDGDQLTGEVLDYYTEWNNDVDPIKVDTENLKSKIVLKGGRLTELYEYWKDGSTKRICFYNDGLPSQKNKYRNGEDISYYENGQLEFKGNFTNNKRNGEHVDYYKNGQILSKINYIDDVEDGEYISYYENGQVESKREYIKGLENGEHISYYQNGQLMIVEVFANGNRKSVTRYSGSSLLLDEIGRFGKLLSKIHYDNNKPNGEYVEYLFDYYNDEYFLFKKGNYLNGNEDGEWILNTGSSKGGFQQTKTVYKDGRRISQSVSHVPYDEIVN